MNIKYTSDYALKPIYMCHKRFNQFPSLHYKIMSIRSGLNCRIFILFLSLYTFSGSYLCYQHILLFGNMQVYIYRGPSSVDNSHHVDHNALYLKEYPYTLVSKLEMQ